MRSASPTLQAVTIVFFRQRRLLAALVVVIAIATSADAQPSLQAATISGTVADLSGARVAGATVRLAHPGRVLLETTTDFQGNFQISAEPGDYLLETVARGFSPYKLPLLLSAANPITTRIELHVEMGGCGVCFTIEPPIATLDAALSTTLPLLPMPPFKQASRKSHTLGR